MPSKLLQACQLVYRGIHEASENLGPFATGLNHRYAVTQDRVGSEGSVPLVLLPTSIDCQYSVHDCVCLRCSEYLEYASP